MIGLPTQAIEDVKQTLEKIIQKNPEHISVYSLIIEEGTTIEKLINENKLQLPDEETERIMYWTVVNELKENGYNQYEISNFSKKTYESKHNTNCWKQKQYIGLGTSAHSYLNKKRRTTTVSLTPIIFLVLSIVLIIVYLNFEPESFERVEKQGLLTLSYSFVSENQMSIKDKIHNCIIIFILTNIPAVISIYNRIKRNRTITRKKKINEMKLREL